MPAREPRSAAPRPAGLRPADATLLHRVPPRTKLIALIVFAVVVVGTPRGWTAALAGYGTVVVVLIAWARIRPSVILRRLVIEVPFVVFALLLPIVATGPRVQVGPLSLSIEGLHGAGALLAKATLVLLASVVLMSTTEPRRIVLALQSLGLPRQLSSIMAFMLRYLDVIVGEAARMRIARESRGFTPRGPRSWRVLAGGLGALFVRAHGRGERVHLAMLARGHDEARVS